MYAHVHNININYVHCDLNLIRTTIRVDNRFENKSFYIVIIDSQSEINPFKFYKTHQFSAVYSINYIFLNNFTNILK